MPRWTMSAKDRLLSKTSKPSGEGGCWEFTGTLYKNGYGSFSFGGKKDRAHRVAYLLLVGEIADGLFVLHKCDNKKCVNPGHLFLGTHQDNMDDMLSKGRRVSKKLNEESVREIRRLHGLGESHRELARRFLVTKRLIQLILSGRRWRYVS